MQVVADRLSLRWYLGYDLPAALPDHSSLTRIRERYGLAVFRRFFEAIVEQCVAAGLVWGEELSIDATAGDGIRPVLHDTIQAPRPRRPFGNTVSNGPPLDMVLRRHLKCG